MRTLALILWLVRGGTVSELKPRVAGPALEPVAAAVEPIDPRTIADVEADMTRVNRLLMEHRSRQGATVNRIEIRDGMPALPTQELNWLHEEWRALHG